MGKKQKTRNWSNTQGKSPEKGKKDGNYTEHPRILPDRIPQEREAGKIQNLSRNKKQGRRREMRPNRNPNTRYPRQRHHQPVDRPDSGKEDPHISIRLATYTSARATATSGARAGELMIGEVEPAELERIRGRSSSEL